MKYQDLTSIQKHTTKMTFIKFLQRDNGFSAVEAEMEFNFLVVNGQEVIPQYYVFNTRRAGSTKHLSRLERYNVFTVFQNAINHSTFEEH